MDRTVTFLPANIIRGRFSQAMSEMYRREVPQYGELLAIVTEVNAATMATDRVLRDSLTHTGEIDRLGVERHGAIRVGTAAEISMIRRIFAIMGMHPVGYYDLAVAGVPVHSTAFRPIDEVALTANPFRVFTSLLRLDLIEDAAVRAEAAAILAGRDIFTPAARALTEQAEHEGGLDEARATRFVDEVLETFRWHGEAIVDADTYRRLHDAHRLIADIVSFKGPHINHLTPRTLDIDAAQRAMRRHGIAAKAVIEGPPVRRCPILLRQTSFTALEEPVRFTGDSGGGTHTARFGEIEQRGIALTPKGFSLYDRLLSTVRDEAQDDDYAERLAAAFAEFPDDAESLRKQGLGYFRYSAIGVTTGLGDDGTSLESLIETGRVRADPIIYEDFLPVSAAGIFQSNLGGKAQKSFRAEAARESFEAALGTPVTDGFALYEAAERQSIDAVSRALGLDSLRLIG